MYKVTVAVMKIETREINATSKEHAKEIAMDDPENAVVLEVEWMDPEPANDADVYCASCGEQRSSCRGC